MNRFSSQLRAGASVAALAVAVFAVPANAQDSVESITVSASRINIEGYVAPTPVVVLGLDKLERDARINLGDELRTLPQLRRGSAITSGSNHNNAAQANAGADTLNLRNLGSNRNLVLIDGQRVVTSQIQDGSVDLNTLPDAVLERVDIVTGGVSAAWGSDAVTGVINLVLNKKFEGFKGNIEFSNSSEVEYRSFVAQAAWGTSFLGGRGHFVLAGTFKRSDDTVFDGQRDFDNDRPHGRELVYNPNYCAALSPVSGTANRTCATVNPGQPLVITRYNTSGFQTTQGGIINNYTLGSGATGVPAPSAQQVRDNIQVGLPPGGLIGTMFVGPGAVPTAFNFGTVSNTTCYGACSNDHLSGTRGWQIAAIPFHSTTLFNYTSYQLTDSIKASIQLNYGTLRSKNTGAVREPTSERINPDNPYLPASVASQFGTLSNGYNTATGTYTPASTVAQRQAAPSQSLTVGLAEIGNRIATGPTSDDKNAVYTYANLCSAVGQPCNEMYRQLQRGVFTLEGTLFDRWNWTAYAQHSGVRITQKTANNPITARLTNAIDAVRITPENVGTSGLPVGTIQCRALLLAPTSTNPNIAGCQPVNILGYNNVSQAAYQWINPGTDPRSGILNRETVYLNQDVFSVSMNGILPWALPAGEVAVAFGGEYRHEQAKRVRSTNSLGLPNFTFQAGNFPSYSGQYNVKEGFIEVNAPILKDSIVQTLNVTAAGRLTHYSVSGQVETWKLGLQSQVNDDFMVRATWSLDIRAPLVDDLYATGGFNNQNNCPNLITQSTFSPCQFINGGNLNLVPEKANTISAGIVFTPTFIEGFRASLDWYQIHLHGGLTTVAGNDIATRCRLGELNYCASILGRRADGEYAGIFVGKVNAALLSTAGFDFVADYGLDVWNGQLDLGVNLNYTYDYSQDLLGVRFQGAGLSDARYNNGARLRGELSATYKEGPWSGTIVSRFTGDSRRFGGTQGQPGVVLRSVAYSPAGTPILSSGELDDGLLDDNYKGALFPIDLRASYDWNDNVALYAAVDNIQNLPDDSNLRRQYRVGFRFNY
ncbi:MAG TPA: TonB-dependent receptor [Rhizomicrobium sp.]|nr:TonB-dependent receptor [Rhizomicrobium sp.]